MSRWIADLPWIQIWATTSTLIGVAMGGIITYKVTNRQVSANIKIAERQQQFQAEQNWRSVQLEAFRNIQANLWRVVIFAAEAHISTERAFESATNESEAFREIQAATLPFQTQSQNILHQLDVDIAILGDDQMRSQLDKLRAIGIDLTSSFADPKRFELLHLRFTEQYEIFRHNAAANVITILLAPIGEQPDRSSRIP